MPASPAASSLDDIVLFTLDRRASARKQAKDAAAIRAQAKKTLAMLNDKSAPREIQNAAVAELVDLCGSENGAATRLGKRAHVIQVRHFEASQTFLDLRALWPNTESSLLMTLLAKGKSDPVRFDRYLRPYLDANKGRKLLRSEFELAWKRAMNNGMLPEEKILLEKREAENMTEMVLTETSAIEQELKAVREAYAALEAKAEALQNALNSSTQEAATGLDDDLKVLMEGSLSGKSVSLEGLLQYMGKALSDRVLILDSAVKSARESDKAGFTPVEPVADLLFKLARGCVDRYRQGGHFLPTEILGNAFADSEGTGPMTDGGVKRRTFSYNGKTVQMMTHLKIGTGWNKGTTFRAHFCYDADLQKVVIGHFGKHLDR
ncbi:MAG: hypothetical protein ACYCPA_03630 [Acidithiobacillus sp.]